MTDNKNILTVKQDHVIPLPFRMVSGVLFFIFLLNLIFSPFQGVKLIVFGVIMYFCIMIFTARRYIQFDMKGKRCFHYAWVLGLKLGNKRSFNYVEKLFVNKVNLVSVNQYESFPGRLSESRSTVFKCFLKFDDGEKIFFDSDTDMHRLLERLKRFNRLLKTSIFDTTSREPILVESREEE